MRGVCRGYSSFKLTRSIINMVTMQTVRTGRTMTLALEEEFCVINCTMTRQQRTRTARWPPQRQLIAHTQRSCDTRELHARITASISLSLSSAHIRHNGRAQSLFETQCSLHTSLLVASNIRNHLK